MDRLAERMSADVAHLVQRRQERACLHLHDRVHLAIEEVQVVAVLQERALDGHRPLIVQNRAALEKGCDIRVAEGVVEAVGIVGVLVVNGVRDQYVADVAIQRGGLAQHVHAGQVVHCLGDLAQNVVARHPQRIVDVENHGV